MAAIVYALRYTAEFTAGIERAGETLRRAATPLALLLAAALAIHAWRFGTFVAGSADSYGYVNQAYDWAAGRLPAPIPLRLSLPLPSDRVQIPLGYTPGARPHTMVPVYAPGLPLIMAASLVAGPCGPYLVVPGCAALFVWFTFVLGRRTAGPLTGLLAAALAAMSPIALFQSEWPMSDVPAGACWTAALVFALGPRSAAVAGVATAMGLLIRPNLLCLVLVPFVYATLRTPKWHERLWRAALFAVSVLAAAIVIAVLNTIWYGAPWKSGYGPASALYGFGHVWVNVRQYATWLWQSESPFVLFAGVPLLPWIAPTKVRRGVLPCAVLAAGALLSYVAYIPFDAWWYLRFLLPGFGAFAVLMAAGLAVFVRRMPLARVALPAIALVLAVFVYNYRFALRENGFPLDGERRYIDIARFVADNLPADAAILTMQHSGSIRFYGGRYSLRYDAMGPAWNVRLPRILERKGYHPYLVIDDWERPKVARRFGLRAGEALPWLVTAQLPYFGGVSVFDLGTVSASADAYLQPILYGPPVWRRSPWPCPRACNGKVSAAPRVRRSTTRAG